MYAYTNSQLQCINAVLKLSRPDDARREIENYLNFVKWYLPYSWRVEQLGTAMLDDVGAICYSFAYNDDLPFQSAAKYMRDKKTSEIFHVIDQIFEPSRQRWYHKQNVVQDEGDLKQYYQHRWFEGRTDAEEVFRRVLRQFDQSQRNIVTIGGCQYSMPRGFLLGSAWGEFQSCIRHGDLHGGNVLISNAGDLAFIDFQDTGRGHVFEDFVTFEASIRLNYEAGGSLEELILQENAQFDKGDSQLAYSSLLQRIRRYAFDNFPDENPTSYAFALGLYCYRLLRIPDLTAWQLNQLVACTLAVVKHLKEKRISSRG
jgi:hypothetical protein